ncbi:MAG: hypothetical protein KDC10_14585 [Calditrichaeota bacterium]|nr:hypothetical protein [Calditrichota bacterium]
MKSFCTRLAARLGLLGLSLLMLPSVQAAVDPDSLAPGLAPLAPWVGLTFRGELADSTPEQPKVDVQHWERILNGQAIRIMHSINEGEYGGETLVIWDSERQTIAYWYVTTAGFHTEGTITVDGNTYTSTETVSGNANGITQVEGSGEQLEDGTLLTRSRYLQNGQWVEGHSATYHEDPTAVVRFR